MANDIRPVKKAAERLGISIWTLRKKVYEGDIAFVKIGAKPLIPDSEIQGLISDGWRPTHAAECLTAGSDDPVDAASGWGVAKGSAPNIHIRAVLQAEADRLRQISTHFDFGWTGGLE